jgi:ubiquitin-like-conjugating enzyme ATG3
MHAFRILNFVLLPVPCLRRAISLEEEYDAAGAEVVLDDDDDGEGWLATHGVQG